MKRLTLKAVKLNKNAIAAGALVILIAVASYLGFRSDQSANENELAQGSPNPVVSIAPDAGADGQNVAAVGAFFQDFKTERASTREKELAQLDSIINDTKTDEQTLKQAQQQKLLLTDAMEKELTMEGLVKAQGFADAIVTVNTNSINVVVRQAVLSEEQVAQILDIVCRESGQAAENVKIIPSK